MMYGNTPKKRLHEMKKELLNFKRKVDRQERIAEKNGYMPMQYLLECDFADTNSYEVITSDGICFAIDCETRVFPDIDFKKIIYIRKDFVSTRKTFDTLTGFTDDSIREVAKKYNVTEWVGYDRD